jgi:hypothetical protein
MKASRVGSIHVGSSNGGGALGSAKFGSAGSGHGAGARSFKTKRLSSPATWHLPLTAWMGDPTTEQGGGAVAGGGHIGHHFPWNELIRRASGRCHTVLTRRST